MLSTEQADVHWGDPIQVWKWPAIAILAYWQSVYMVAPGDPWLVGGYLGAIVGAGIGALVLTYLWRKAAGTRIGTYLQWWKWSLAATVAAVLSAPVTGAPTGLFMTALVLLAGLVWIATVIARATTGRRPRPDASS